jgi:hypothetical protein
VGVEDGGYLFGFFVGEVADPYAQRDGGEELELYESADLRFVGIFVYALDRGAVLFGEIVGDDDAGVEVAVRDQYLASRRALMTDSLADSPFRFIDARNSVRSGNRPGSRFGGTRRATSLPRRRIEISSPDSARCRYARRFSRTSLTFTRSMLSPFCVRDKCTRCGEQVSVFQIPP